MLRPDEQLVLGHAGMSPQARATVQNTLGNRAVILNKTPGDQTLATGNTAGGETFQTNGLYFANITVPAGNTIANTVAATTFANTFLFAARGPTLGQVFFIKAWGVFGTAVVAPTLKLDVTWQGTVLATTGTQTLTANLTNQGWCMEAQTHLQSVGAASFETQGIAFFDATAASDQIFHMANTAPVAVSTNLTRTLAIQVTWGAASASNTITLRNFSLRVEQAQQFI